MRWNLLFGIPSTKLDLQIFKGDVCGLCHSILYRFGGELVIQDGHFSYDRESKKLNFHQCDSSDYVINCYPRTPSLVLLPGMSSVDSQRKKISFPNCSRPPWQLIESLKKQ